MLVKSFQTESDKNRYNSTYTEEMYNNDHPMQPVTALKPAMFKDKNQASFSNSTRYSGGPTTPTTLQNRNTATSFSASPLASPAIDNSFSGDAYAMNTPIDRTSTSGISSTAVTTPTDFNGIMNDSKTSYWSNGSNDK